MLKDGVSLATINDDALVVIFSYLSVPSILALRQASKRMARVSSFRIVWQNACIFNVISCGYPLPSLPLRCLPDLEETTKQAYYLGTKWLSHDHDPRTIKVIDAHPSTSIEDVKFVPRKNWIFTMSKGIWSVISAWDITLGIIKLSEWSPKGGLFICFTVNTDPDSRATLAVSVKQDSSSTIEILTLQRKGKDNKFIFETVTTIDTDFRPIALQGDILAFSNSIADTVIWNWKKKTRAALRHTADAGLWQWDRCIQVVFAYECILVVRARSIHLFKQPVLTSIEPMPSYSSLVHHSFGWVNDISISLSPRPDLTNIREFPSHDPISVLVRSESDDPWSQEQHKMQFFTLEPNPTYQSLTQDNATGADISPYRFPPNLVVQVSSIHGALRCTDIKLQPYGTAVWVHPHNRAIAGLISSDIHLQAVPSPYIPAANERLVAAVFPGRLRASESNVETRTLWTNMLNDWCCMDYDENSGRIVLGSFSGSLTIVEL